jgi:hydrogenase/urease accessory protein HupE
VIETASLARGAIVRRVVGVLVLAAAMLVALPGQASAHGIDGHGKSVPGFLWSGVTHMLLGWDHLLFVAGVVVLAGAIRRAAKLISLFAVGHSLTLMAATLAQWRVSATAVDVVIALSLVFVGAVALAARPARWPAGSKRWAWFAVAVFGFGLIHGLGLATRLQAVGLPDDGLLARVLAFNVGVELGQLLAVSVLFVAVTLVADKITRPAVWRSTQAALISAGILAATVLSVSAATGTEDPGDARAATTIGACRLAASPRTYPYGAGGHPAKDFFEPAEPAPLGDFGHLIGDGYVIVHYPASLPIDQLDALRAFVTGPDGQRVVAGADRQGPALLAVHGYREAMTCDRFDLPALREFTTRWFADPRSRPTE